MYRGFEGVSSRKARYLLASESDMTAVVRVFGVVAAVLPGKIDFVLLGVRLVKIFGGDLEHLRNGDQKMQEVDHLDFGILLVKLLIFRPPLPRDAVGKLGD